MKGHPNALVRAVNGGLVATCWAGCSLPPGHPGAGRKSRCRYACGMSVAEVQKAMSKMSRCESEDGDYSTLACSCGGSVEWSGADPRLHEFLDRHAGHVR